MWARGFGRADVERGEAATADTLYRIGSITKLFTATAILLLRDAGRLGLDDPLTAHLPWFDMKASSPDSGPITIRHLLTHTAGLPREAAFPYFTDSRFPSIDEIRARLPTQERPLPTEDRWKYSNLGATLAGEVVAAAAGEPTSTSSAAASSSRSGCCRRWWPRPSPATRTSPPATRAGSPRSSAGRRPSTICAASPPPAT